MMSATSVSSGSLLASSFQGSACALSSSSFLGAQVCPVQLTGQCRPQHARVKAKGTGFFKLPGTVKRKVADTAESAKPALKSGSIFQKAAAKVPQGFQLPGTARQQRSDPNTVFVAGATGKVGIRTVRELSALGFKVRAGVRNVQKAQEALAFATQYALVSPQQARLIDVVEYDLDNPETIPRAIGNASKVVAAIGAGESAAGDVKGPYRVDGEGAKALIRAAVEANVAQFVMVSSIGAGKVGFPAALLNLFWGVLVWKRQAEIELENSGMAFTIVRPGGMERPTDDYKKTHNVRLAAANTEFGGQVSQLQVAEVIGAILSNPSVSENKIVEVVAETDAPLVSLEEQLAALPVTGLTQAERVEKQRQEEEEEARREQERRDAEARAAEEAAERERQRREAEEERERQRIAAERRAEVAAELQALRAEEAEAKREAAAAEREAAQAQAQAEQLLAQLQEAAQAAKEARAVEKAALQAARRGETFGARERAEVLAEVREESRPAPVSIDRETKRTADAAKAKAAAAKKKQEAAEDAREKAEQKLKDEAEKEKAAQAKEKADAAAAKQRDAEEKKAADAKKAAEAKRKEQEAAEAAEAKKKEAQAKAERDAEAKKAEEEKKKEAQAKAERDAEEAKKAAAKEAERKKQEEEARVLAQQRAEADQKKKEEGKKKEEEKKKADVEAKKKEIEAKAKAEAERRKEEERQRVISGAVAEDQSRQEESKPKFALGGFKWPWQQAPEEEEEEQQAAPEAKKSTDLPPSPTPLSPYTMYDDLKPPTSPTPIPAGGKSGLEAAQAAAKAAAEKTTSEAPKAVEAVKKEAPKAVEAVKKEAPKAVEEAKKEAPKVVEAVKKEAPKVVEDVKKEAPKVVEEVKKEAPKVVADIKKEAPKAVEKAVDAAPAPAKEAASKVTATAKDVQKSEPVKAAQEKVEEVVEDVKGFKWPWEGAPIAEPVEKAAETVKAFKWPWEGGEGGEDGEDDGAEASQGNGAFPRSSSLDLPYANRPLSPYTQYPDLKPPTSPMPSPPSEVKNRAKNDSVPAELLVKKTYIRE